MFICPTCEEEFNSERAMREHFLRCWKEKHPFHQSKSAPRSEDIVTREVNEDITNFFNSLIRGK